MPRGVVLIGVPGSGKSVAAESIIARELQLPMVVFNFSAVFNSLVGESERRMEEVLSLVKAIDGCVLLIDEADKALGGAADSVGDSGVTRRVFGSLLTWLANKNDRTFVVMTLNRVNGLPPELLRKGRFDELFYADVPNDEERRAIFDIHLVKRGISPKLYSSADWKKILSSSRDLVGAEIEAAVESARFESYQVDPSKKAVPSAEQLVAAATSIGITRVTRVDPENVKAIREFGATRARSVSCGRISDLEKESARSLNLGPSLGFSNN
jgi:SpoVK/Ycf46/Vps4 family AAA+-type ATPase